MNSIKKLYLIVALIFVSGAYAFAQTTGMKIVSVHPDLKIKVTRCEAADKTVIIDLVFENVGNTDTDLRLWAGRFRDQTIAYDDEGNIFCEPNFRIQFGNSDLSDWWVQKTLPSEIPIKGRIQIDGVPESSTMFKRVDVYSESDAWGFKGKIIRITNVPISREGDE